MMKTGGKFLLMSGCLAASGCAANHTVQVRAIAEPDSKLHYSGGLLAEARGQLAMGAVGLALESFRTLQRQQPDNSDVYAGIAACYAEMGRYDLTRTNYELALAYAPDDPGLLQALASTLDRLGETEQAAQVRTEVRMAAARAAQPKLAQAPVTGLGVPRATSMTVKLPEPLPARTVARAAEPRIAAPKLSTAEVDLATARLVSMSKPALIANAQVAIAPVDVPPAVLALAQEPPAKFTVPAAGVDLHVTRAYGVPERALEYTAPVLVTEAAVPTAPAAMTVKSKASPTPPPTRISQVEGDDTPAAHGPYLERTSLREVALITIVHPEQQARLKPRTPEFPRMALVAASIADRPPAQPAPRPLLAAAAVRWVPLRYASRGQNIELLNAARTDGLAARTRLALVNRGWRKVAIGNARSVRQRSLVLYSPGRWHVAARLAAQFRCKAVRMASVKSVIVLLGRDAAFRRGATSRA